MTGRWKRPRPGHTEGTAQPVKDPSDEEDNLPQTSKRQATSATLDALAEPLGSFHQSARALANCLQKRDVTRKTDQSVIEAAKCMLGEVKEDLDRVTAQSQEGLCTEIKQNNQRCPRDIESEPYQLSTERHCRNLQPVHQSKLSRMILGSSSSCRYLSFTLESGNTNSKCGRSVRQF